MLYQNHGICDNCSSALQQYDEIDAPDNFSDHVAVKCVMNINVEYVYHDEDNSKVLKQRSFWIRLHMIWYNYIL